MCRGNNKKQKAIHDGRDRTTKSLGVKETYKYLRILEANTIKQVEMKENIFKKYLRRMRKVLETKLYS